MVSGVRWGLEAGRASPPGFHLLLGFGLVPIGLFQAGWRRRIILFYFWLPDPPQSELAPASPESSVF